MDAQEPVASSSKVEPQRLSSAAYTSTSSPPDGGSDRNTRNIHPLYSSTTWTGWEPTYYAGHGNTTQGYSHAHHHQTMNYHIPMTQQNPATSHAQASRKHTTSPTPSPPPPPSESYRYWDAIIKVFLSQAGLAQALRGFEDDMLVLNPTWEQEAIPGALEKLQNNLKLLDQARYVGEESPRPHASDRPLEERKLDYVHLSNGNQPQSQTSVNKSISAFLARNRARNDKSNRTEFLHVADTGNAEAPKRSSCARTDAKYLDRDVQMKYDIAKNEEGPLRRTVKNPERSVPEIPSGSSTAGKGPSLQGNDEGLASERHPGLDQRFANIEAHLAVRYVPSPPRSLLARLKFLEDHLVMLEKEYPPWAALHFNQPNRGWPPPPRSTPIIVPAQLRSGTPASSSFPQGNPPEMLPTVAGGSKPRNTASSLHRAVLERLEVQQAMNDLASSGGK